MIISELENQRSTLPYVPRQNSHQGTIHQTHYHSHFFWEVPRINLMISKGEFSGSSRLGWLNLNASHPFHTIKWMTLNSPEHPTLLCCPGYPLASWKIDLLRGQQKSRSLRLEPRASVDASDGTVARWTRDLRYIWVNDIAFRHSKLRVSLEGFSC